MTEVPTLIAVAGILVLAAALIALVIVSEARLKQVAAEQRRIHLQQANIVSMLIRAGFRPASAQRDWGDSGHWTQLRHPAPYAAERPSQSVTRPDVHSESTDDP